MKKPAPVFITVELVVLGVLLIVTAILVSLTYQRSAQKAYTASLQAYQELDCTGAVGQAVRVMDNYRYISSVQRERLAATITECSLLLYAGNGATLSSFAESAAAYDTYFTLASPAPSQKREIRGKIARVTYDRANQLASASRYDQALEKYLLLLQQYPDVYIPKAVEADIVDLLAKWSQDYYQQGDYPAALEKSRLILFYYPSVPGADGVVTQILRINEDWGKKLVQQGKYDAALEAYQNLIALYEPLHYPLILEQARSGAAHTYELWADALRTRGQFADALKLYRIIIEQYPNTVAAQNASQQIRQTQVDWANDLQRSGSFEAAILKFSDNARQWQGTPEAERSLKQIPGLYLEWGNALKIQGNYPAAVEKYLHVLTAYQTSEAAAASRDALAYTYIAWGNQFYDQKQYWDALKKYHIADWSTQSKTVIAEVRANTQKALQSLAVDSEGQGKLLLGEGLKAACSDEQPPVPDAFDRLVEQPGKGLACEQGFDLPSDLKAVNPAQFRYIVVRKVNSNTLEKCFYPGGKTLIRRRPWWLVTVKRAFSADVVDVQVYYGLSPEACPADHTFSSDVEYLDGTDPDLDPLYDWLREVFQ